MLAAAAAACGQRLLHAPVQQLQQLVHQLLSVSMQQPLRGWQLPAGDGRAALSGCWLQVTEAIVCVELMLLTGAAGAMTTGSLSGTPSNSSSGRSSQHAGWSCVAAAAAGAPVMWCAATASL
jgi:hypothetical protein